MRFVGIERGRAARRSPHMAQITFAEFVVAATPRVSVSGAHTITEVRISKVFTNMVEAAKATMSVKEN